MSVILVAEQDASYAERIVEVLSSAGWEAKAVVSRETAFEAANAQRPGLLIASASLPEASSLLAAFSRNRGGPGAVVLVPVAVAGRVSAADYQADALLDKPFSDDALTQLVGTCLGTKVPPGQESRLNSGDQPPPAGPGEPEKAAAQQLTSEQIFGDVLAEVEAEAQRSKATRRQRAARASDDVERKLEETLSGVFPLGEGPKRSLRTEAGTSLAGAAAAAPSTRKPRSRGGLPSDHEIEDLLDKTLSSLDLNTRPRKVNSEGTRQPTPQPATQPTPPPATQPPPQEQTPLAAGTPVDIPAPTALKSEPSAPPASKAWEGFEPPPELFPVDFGESLPVPLPEPPSSVPEMGLLEPVTSPFEPPKEAAAPDRGAGPNPLEISAGSAAVPLPHATSSSDLFPTSFSPTPAEESTDGPELLSESFDGPGEVLSLDEEPLPDLFSASLGDQPTSKLLAPDSTREMFELEPLEPWPAEIFSASSDQSTEVPPTEVGSTLSDDLTFDLFPASFGETSPAPAEDQPELGTDLPPELFPSSFGENAPTSSWDTPSDIPPPPELALPVAPPVATGLETQRLPAMGGHSFLEPGGPSTTSLQDAPAQDITAQDLRENSEPFTTHRMVALEDIATPPGQEGEPFGDYTLIDRVAVGGMAEVWRARRRGVEGFQKTVAIKRILAHLTDTPDFINMFIDEAKLAAQLSHNHIIQIYDLGKVGSDFFIAMEFVDGKDLRSILDKARKLGRPLPIELALMIVAALARALDYAHRKKDFENRAMGLVHRDVSPQNVLISYEGEIKLCDFGIVKAVAKASTTQMGALKGKLQYMSPEQAWGKSVDARSDIFSLGSVLFEVLTGERLFTGDSELSVLDAVRECRVRSPRDLVPDVPEEVDQIVRRALTGTPEERYQTAKELEEDIKSAFDALRLTPSQGDLAAYVGQLFNPPVEFHNYEATETSSPAVLTENAPSATGEEAREGLPSAQPDTMATEARPRRWFVPVLLVVALAALAALAFLVMSQRGGSSTQPTGTSTETPAPDAASPALQNEEHGTGETEGGGAATTTAPTSGETSAEEEAGPEEGITPRTGTNPGTAAGEARSDEPPAQKGAPGEGGAAGLVDVDRLVEERLAETEREIQRKYDAQLEAESQRIQRELEETQRNLKNPPKAPPQEKNPDETDYEESDGR